MIPLLPDLLEAYITYLSFNYSTFGFHFNSKLYFQENHNAHIWVLHITTFPRRWRREGSHGVGATGEEGVGRKDRGALDTADIGGRTTRTGHPRLKSGYF